MDSEDTLLRTFVAPLLASGGGALSGDRPICWLDCLLQGRGFRKPAKHDRPLVILLVGPPGTGKSLLAQQICYNRALAFLKPEQAVGEKLQRAGATSLFIATETSPAAIFDNMRELGFDNVTNREGFYAYDELLPEGTFANPPESNDIPLMVFMDAMKILPAVPPRKGRKSADEVPWKTLAARVRDAWNKAVQAAENDEIDYPTLAVVDSLNILNERLSRGRAFDALFQDFMTSHTVQPAIQHAEFTVGRPEFLILVLDTPSASEMWEYRADAVIRLDYHKSRADYFTRELEIVKMRFQHHTLGSQLVKIFEAPAIEWTYTANGGKQRVLGTEERAAKKAEGRSLEILNLNTDREGPRPNIRRGGFFVFPSLHYVLSQIRARKKLIRTEPSRPALVLAAKPKYEKERSKSRPAAFGPGPIAVAAASPASVLRSGWSSDEKAPALNWPVSWCYELVSGGMPLNCNVAVVGPRGARQGLFLYQFLLDGAANGERVLLLSFRDNPVAANATLARVAGATRYSEILPSRDDIQAALGRIEVLYQRPGYILPEEWLHRVITAVGEHSPTRCALLAVDQWEATHPLLAESSILLPTLVDFLGVHEVTSMIAGIETKGASLFRCGLTASAEVVLSIEPRLVPWSDSVNERRSKGLLDDWFPEGVPLLHLSTEAATTASRIKVIMRATRVLEGGPRYGRALLEYSATGGLELIPLAPEFPDGARI